MFLVDAVEAIIDKKKVIMNVSYSNILHRVHDRERKGIDHVAPQATGALKKVEEKRMWKNFRAEAPSLANSNFLSNNLCR